MEKENGHGSEGVPRNGKWWSRRLISTIVWGILLNVAFFLCLGIEDGLEWFSEYGKFMTFGLVFLVGGLTLTDLFGGLKRKEK